MQNRPNQNQARPKSSSPRKPYRRKRKNKNKGVAFVVMVGLVLLMLCVALLLVGTPPAQPVSSVSSQSRESSKPVISSETPPQSSNPLDEYNDPLRKYYEPGLPLLLNPDHSLPEGYMPNLSDIGSGYQLDSHAAAAFLDMQAAAAEDGVVLWVVSAYRSHQYQLDIYNAKIKLYEDQGYSKEEALRLTQQYHAIPGTSEHEAGLAVDLNSLLESFAQTPEFVWLKENCSDYGFILRYEKETEPITRIAYEPWHYRYVGINHAKAIEKAGITLDEYIENMM